MAKLYTEQAVSDFATGKYSSQGNVGQYLEKEGTELVAKAEKSEQEAKEQYAQAVQIGWQNAMNGIANNPQFAANPTAMQAEMKKLNDKMASEIVDRDVKYNFLVNAELKGQSMLNSATANFNKIQRENTKNINYNGIASSIKSIGTAIFNGVSGTANANDLIVASGANETIRNLSNSVYDDGSRVFSISEAVSFEKALEKEITSNVKNAFDMMPENRKKAFAESVYNGNAVLGVVKNKDIEKEIKLSDVLSKESYNSVARYLKQHQDDEYKTLKYETAKREFFEKQQMANNELSLSAQLEDMSAVDQINALEENRDAVSEKYYEAKRKAITSELAITPKTNQETFSSLMKSISMLDPNEQKDFVELESEILTRIEETTAKGELLRKDKAILLNAINRAEKPDIEKVGDKLDGMFSWGFDYEDAAKYIKNTGADESKEYDTMLEYYRSIEGKDYDSKQRREVLATLVEKKNRDAFLNGTVRDGSVLAMADKYFKENLPENMQKSARESLLSETSNMVGSQLERETEYRKAAIDVADKIQQSIRMKSQDAYANIMNMSDSDLVKRMAESRGKSVEEFDSDIDFTAKKYGLTREQVINKLKGAL